MCRLVWILAVLVAPLFAVGAETACDVQIGAPTVQEGRWTYVLEVKASGWVIAGAVAREHGEDLILEMTVPGRSSTSDVAPSRYAIERASLLLHGSAHARLVVKGYDGALRDAPQLAALCLLPQDVEFLPALLWQALVELVHRSDNVEDASGWQAACWLAINGLQQFQALGRARGFAPEWTAMAFHARGYLLSRMSRHGDAQAEFGRAQIAWQRLGLVGAAAAARFNRAQEALALGHAAQALDLLQPLLGKAMAAAAPPVWMWANNDRCVALRNLDRREESVECLAHLVRLLDARHEPKEAANSACNLGSSLGALGRWKQAAPVLRECSERRQALGLPRGIAHAELLLGWLALETDTVDRAVAHFQASLDQAMRAGDLSRAWDAQRWLAQAWLDGDEIPRARAALERLIPDPAQEGSRNAQWHLALAQVALYADDMPEASAHFAAATSGFERIGQTAALTDARCLWSVIDVHVPISPACDALTAAQAYLRRGDMISAAQHLHTPSPSADRDLLRALLLQVTNPSQGFAIRAQLGALIARAATLPSATPRERSQRGQLLARMGYEMARLAKRFDDGELAALAFQALWRAGDAPSGIGHRLDGTTPTAQRGSGSSPSVFPELPYGTVFVVSASFAGEGFLVIARENTAQVEALDMARLDAAAERWRTGLLSRAATAEAAQAVAEALGLPAWWRREDRLLILGVHGSLSTIPWSALPIDGDPVPTLAYRPLVDQAATVFAAAGELTPPPAAAGRNIRFVPEAADATLPGSLLERREIGALALRSGWRIDAQESAPDGIVHLAGHAVADLVDADGSRWLSDADNLFSAQTGHASLVVLAGCETGLGPASRWTTPASLASRAIDAGAQASMAHLWPIADATAARLHVTFYREIFSGSRMEDALRTAQWELMQAPGNRLPFYWASPVLLESRRELATALQANTEVTTRAAVGESLAWPHSGNAAASSMRQHDRLTCLPREQQAN